MADQPSSYPTPAAPPQRTAGGIAPFIIAGVLLGGLIFLGYSIATPRHPSPKPAVASVDTIDAVLNAAENHRKLGELAKAEAVLRNALASAPDERVLYTSLAETLLLQNKPADAYAQYERAIAVGPKDPKLELGAGTVANMAGKLDRAVEHFAAVQLAEPANWEASLFLAQVQLKLNDLGPAKKNLLLAATLKPDSAIAWGTLGEIALRENAPNVALQHIDKARALEPDNLLWRLLQARAQKRLNKPDEALAILVGLPDAQKRDPHVLQIMIECYGLLNRPGDAADLLAAASDADPADARLALDAALWLEKAARPDAARRYALRAQMLGLEDAVPFLKRLPEARATDATATPR